jgi:alanyl-tRNA synthetase
VNEIPEALKPRLYLEDPLALRFEGEVVAHAALGERQTVLLDRSAFYPESGGQLGDIGALAAARVVDVQLDGEGRVHHVLEGELPAIGARVEGAVDLERRRLHMALHTGQHLLSRALIDVAAAETVSARLGERTCTVDLDKKLSDASAAKAEALVNAIVDDDRRVRALFPNADELAGLALRRAPKVTEDIRIVEVDGFDLTPCGGTHCTRTSQVGLLHVTQLEGYKGKTRVHFAAGPRARARLFGHAELVARLAGRFTCGADEVEANLDRLRAELKSTRQALGAAQQAVLERMVEELEADLGADADVVLVLDADKKAAQSVATRLATGRRRVVIGAAADGGLHVIVTRGPDAELDSGALLKELAAVHGGRGGGRAERAEGRFPAFELEAAVRPLLEQG